MQTRQTEPQDFPTRKEPDDFPSRKEPQSFQSAKDFLLPQAPHSLGIDATSEAAFSPSQNHDLSDPRDKRRFWEQHLEQCRQSHQTQKAYCKKHHLNIHQFYYWKRRLASDHGKVAFLPVDLFKDHSGNHSPSAVRIIAPNGFTIELDSQASLPDILTMVARL